MIAYIVGSVIGAVVSVTMAGVSPTIATSVLVGQLITVVVLSMMGHIKS